MSRLLTLALTDQDARVLSWSVKIYIATVPFIAAFALAPSLPLPLFAAILMAFVYLPLARIRLDLYDPLFAILFFLVLVPWIWSLSYVTQKAVTHLSALLTVFFVFYFIPRHILADQFRIRDGFEKFCNLYAWILFFVSLLMIFEFFGNNFYGIHLNSLIPYPVRQEYQATIIAGIQRSRGLAAESGHMALFFDLGLFLSVIGVRGRFKRWIFWPVVLLGFVTMFSVASFVLVLVAFVYYFIRKFLSHPTIAFRLIVVSALIAVVIWLFWERGIEDYFHHSFIPKFSLLWLGASVGSGASRLLAFTESISLVSNYPFGIGFGIAPAAADIGGVYYGLPISAGYISLFSLFLVAGGILAAVCFLVIHIGFIYRSMKLTRYAELVSAGGVALSLHYLMNGDFYLPFLWLYWALVVALQTTDNRRLIRHEGNAPW